MAKTVGTEPPSAREKDPEFLAMQVRALRGAFDNLVESQKQNLIEIGRAFALTEMHQQVLLRIAQDVGAALVNIRLLQVTGDVTSRKEDYMGLKVTEDEQLDVTAYYSEYGKVVESAGQEHADKAVAYWARGCSIEESVERAKVSDETELVSETPPSEGDYQIEHFGGTSGQGNNQQDASTEASR